MTSTVDPENVRQVARRVGRAGNLPVAALMLALLAGCESEAPPSRPGGSAPPTRSSPGPPATEPSIPDWEFVRIPFEGSPNDAVGGAPGLVVVGICESGWLPTERPYCEPDAPGDYRPSVLSSSDGDAWQSGAVDGGRDGDMTRVVWNGGYVAAGLRCIPERNPRRCYEARIWRSEDGLDWDRIASFPFGKGRNTGPDRQFVGSISASSSGALVLGWVHRMDEPGVSGIYASAAGITWSRVPSTEFGRDWHFGHFRNPYDIVATDAGFAVVGTGCAGCPVRSYRSEDGATWRLAGEAGIDPDLQRIFLATDGRRLVAAVVREAAAEGWTEIWASPDGGTWTRELIVPRLDEPRLAYVGDHFVLVGAFGTVDDWHQVAWLSSDGQSWMEMRPVFRADSNAEPELACLRFVGGGSDGVLVGGAECGVWHADLP